MDANERNLSVKELVEITDSIYKSLEHKTNHFDRTVIAINTMEVILKCAGNEAANQYINEVTMLESY